jgi:hypothetical protein
MHLQEQLGFRRKCFARKIHQGQQELSQPNQQGQLKKSAKQQSIEGLWCASY